ncbi:MAG: hypothetical protein HOJ48_01535 [Desulfobacula sp.]|jgi:hypothetical protein|nr:hypothetical protein [Desulfobacula sp.]
MMPFIISIIIVITIIPMIISSSLLAKLLLGEKDIWLTTEIIDQGESYSNDSV